VAVYHWLLTALSSGGYFVVTSELQDWISCGHGEFEPPETRIIILPLLSSEMPCCSWKITSRIP
jgi:hypothetical protein